MWALAIEGGALDLRDRSVPARPDECLVRVSLAGICGTDLEILAGYAGFSGIPGHEFVGVVEHAPDADADWLGKRVVGEINIGCGSCGFCRDGVKEHCTSRTVVGIRGRDGAFADYVSLPAVNLHAVPDAVSDEAAVFVEPLAAACRVVEQLAGQPSSTNVAVIGDGRLGLLASQVLVRSGARVSIFGRHEEKLRLARKWGAETPQHAAGREFDVVVEATGRPAGLETALSLVRPRGTIVLKSTVHGTAPISTTPIVVDEVTLIGSRCGPFPTALDLLTSGTIEVAPLISARYPLTEWRQAFDAARTCLKVLLDPRVESTV
jgi:2-desacetyl-2-hydroxyethyl bacteriochlorophyllide A dehydrogenase